MSKCFLKPIKTILLVYGITMLGVVADIDQLTGINIIETINKNLPKSYYIILSGTILLYSVLVIIEFVRRKQNRNGIPAERKIGQFINARNIKNSTITSTLLQYNEEHSYAGPLIDQKINEELEFIRQSRFYTEFDAYNYTKVFMERLISGDLINGRTDVRCLALAWCARLLSTQDLEKAEECIDFAKKLGDCTEIKIAEAFIYSNKGDKNTSLKILSTINLPSSKAASLMIVSAHEGHKGAIKWLAHTRIDIKDLDSDGKYYLFSLYLEESEWDAAIEQLDAISINDLKEMPILNHIIAIAQLLIAVCAELRYIVIRQVPFDAANFPLAADPPALDARKNALQQFLIAAEAARKLNKPIATAIEEEYALWLELMDPEESEKGRKKLQDKFRDTSSALRFIRLGLQFGIKFNFDAVEHEINRQTALNGQITLDAAIARFALAFTKRNPGEMADYIDKYKSELTTYFSDSSLQFIYIEMLSKAGKIVQAKENFDILIKQGISETEENNLRRIIAESEGINPIESLKGQYKISNSISDLAVLVEELKNRQDWVGLCEYSKILFEKTRSLDNANTYAQALNNAYYDEQLLDFLKTNFTLMRQSKTLQILYCWALYNEGDLLEARSELLKLSDESNHSNYRELQINLNITLGDWNSLNVYIAEEHKQMSQRSADELIRSAQLALYLGLSQQAKDLLFSAVDKGKKDANILSTAYFLASSAGWENEVPEWLNNAVALSTEKGPIHKMSLKDLLEHKPIWDNQEESTWKQLSQGNMPMFIAADSLNNSLVHMMLFPAYANLRENDLRRRGVIPAYSGNRQLGKLKIKDTIALDATALLTLSYLNLLDKTLDAFETIYISHSTLRWLFEEKRKALFHQPSRIKDAQQIQHLLSSGIIEKFNQTTYPDSDLVEQVGNGLAILISEAEKTRNSDRQCYVVQSYPVQRVSSLMEETADLTEHYPVLTSCQAVIEKLKQKGQITAEEIKNITTFFMLHERPWPNQPEIDDGAVLFFGDVSLNYFQHFGLLEKLKAAGFLLFTSQSELSEANEFISYDKISGEIIEAIERIRATLNIGIVSGKIKVGRRFNIDRTEEHGQSLYDHPTMDIFNLVKYSEAFVADDRSFNQHPYIEGNKLKKPLFSTLELIDLMTNEGIITKEERLEHRTKLRRAGYCFIPVNDYELKHHLVASILDNNKIVETAELKAIKENLLHVRLKSWLQLPKEVKWFSEMMDTFIQVLHDIWITDKDIHIVKAFSDWIVDQIDIRGWAQLYEGEIGDNIVKTVYGLHLIRLLTPKFDASIKVRNEYFKWVEDKVLAPIKDQNYDLYNWIIGWYKNDLINQIDENFKFKNMKKSDIKQLLVNVALQLMPSSIRYELFKDNDFCKKYNILIEVEITLNGFVSFQQSELLNAVRRIFSRKTEENVIDKTGQKWSLTNEHKEGELPSIILTLGEQQIVLNYLLVLSPDKETRLRCLNEIVFDFNLPKSTQEVWYEILSERPLEDTEVENFHNEFDDTPIRHARDVRRITMGGACNPSSLVPFSQKYYERLVGSYDGSSSINDYASRTGRDFFRQLSERRLYDGFLYSLFLSSHSSLTTEIEIEQLSNETLINALNYLEEKGDRLSQLGAIEIGLRILSSKPEIELILIRLIKQIFNDNVTDNNSEFRLLSSLFILTDGELSRTRLFSSKPPFYRRLASLSQAALIHRQLVKKGMDINSFCEWAIHNCGLCFYMQSLIDLRVEPRWLPDYADPSQLKYEFLGRIIVEATKYEQNIKNKELSALIAEIISNIENSIGEFLIPGPLEGNVINPHAVPDILLKTIEAQLSEEEISPLSFTTLVNTARIFGVNAEHAELVAEKIKHNNYRISNVKSKSQLITLINGLATVSAVSRSCVLADELRILVRRYKRDSQYDLTVEDVMRICLTAAASRTELNEWRDFVGGWITELAFGELKGNEGEVLHTYLKYICNAVPDLWVTCGRADAALKAYNSMNNK